MRPRWKATGNKGYWESIEAENVTERPYSVIRFLSFIPTFSRWSREVDRANWLKN